MTWPDVHQREIKRMKHARYRKMRDRAAAGREFRATVIALETPGRDWDAKLAVCKARFWTVAE